MSEQFDDINDWVDVEVFSISLITGSELNPLYGNGLHRVGIFVNITPKDVNGNILKLNPADVYKRVKLINYDTKYFIDQGVADPDNNPDLQPNKNLINKPVPSSIKEPDTIFMHDNKGIFFYGLPAQGVDPFHYEGFLNLDFWISCYATDDFVYNIGAQIKTAVDFRYVAAGSITSTNNNPAEIHVKKNIVLKDQIQNNVDTYTSISSSGVGPVDYTCFRLTEISSNLNIGIKKVYGDLFRYDIKNGMYSNYGHNGSNKNRIWGGCAVDESNKEFEFEITMRNNKEPFSSSLVNINSGLDVNNLYLLAVEVHFSGWYVDKLPLYWDTWYRDIHFTIYDAAGNSGLFSAFQGGTDGSNLGHEYRVAPGLIDGKGNNL